MSDMFIDALSAVLSEMNLVSSDLKRLMSCERDADPIVIQELRQGPYWDPSNFDFLPLFRDTFSFIAAEYSE